MAYATYEFYRNTYYGNSIEEADFNKLLSKSETIINRYTFNRLIKNMPEDESTQRQIGMCACELAEKVMEIDKYIKASTINDKGETVMIKSKSAGSESVTFATGETIYARLVNDNKALETFYYATVKNYLAGYDDAEGINLVYAGV